MKILRLLFICLALSLHSCSSGQETFNPVESNFPMKLSQVLPVNNLVKRIAVSDSWVAVYSSGSLTAIDINSQKTLWQTDLEIQADDEMALQIVDDTIIAAFSNQVFLISKSGEKKELRLESQDNTWIKLVSFYPDYVYIIRFPEWRLEAYSISKNIKLWDVLVGRGGADVFYEKSNNIAYVTTRDNSLLAIDNATGDVLWKQDRSSLHSVIEQGVIYTIARGNKTKEFRLSAFDVNQQKELWASVTPFGSNAYNLSIVGELLVVSGNEGLLALSKSNGTFVWQTPKGEQFQTQPTEINGVLYAKAISLTVYAISPSSGEFIGYVRLEESGNNHPMYEVFSGVYEFDDGILFNTKNAVVIYKPG